MPAPASGTEEIVMGRPAGRRGARPTHTVWIGRLLRSHRAAADLFARSLGDVLPFAGVVVLLRALAGAGVLRRAAVVLTTLGDAVALLGFLGLGGRLADGGGSDPECEDAGERGGDGRLVIHG